MFQLLKSLFYAASQARGLGDDLAELRRQLRDTAGLEPLPSNPPTIAIGEPAQIAPPTEDMSEEASEPRKRRAKA